ncbi:MAG: putative abductin-like protein [Myxococcales bacterium]|nr:putative abductin-like protein [Myxococcales bacterium]
MPSGVNVPLTFEIYKVDPKGDQYVRTETLTQDIIKVGKLSSSHLRIDDEAVSRMHAVIEIAGPGEIYIIDLGSTKGTLVNGQKVNKTKLQSGDQIVLGNTKLVVSVGEPVASQSDDGPTQVQMPPQGAPAPAPAAARQTVMGMSAPQAPQAAPQAPTMQQPAPSFPPPPVAVPAPAPFQQATVQAPFQPPPQQYQQPPAPSFPAPQAAAPQSFGAQNPFGQPAQQAASYRQPAQPMSSFTPPPGFDPSAVEVQDGSRAIEVNAMFEDAIIEVAHLSNPQAGTITGATKGLLGSGFLSLAVAFITFVVAYVQAGATRRAWDAWDASGKPHAEFIVPREGPALDILFVVCLVFGIYAVFHGLFKLFGERGPRDFTIGPDATAQFNAPGEYLPVGAFPLVRSTGTDYELLFTQQMSGDVTVNNQTIPLAQLASQGAHQSSTVAGAYAWAIPNGARAKIDLGQNTFLVSSVPPPRTYASPMNVDWGQQAYTAATALAVMLFLFMVYSIPPDPKSLSLDAFMNDKRFAQFLIKPPEEKEEQIPEWLKKKSNDEAGGKGKRHKGEEGKMGKKTSKNKSGLYGLKGPKDNPDPHLAKMLAEESAQKAGVLGILKSQEGSHLASIFGRDSALGNDAENVLGGLVGTQIGEAYGVGGLGLVGSGKGGGGTGEGTIGLGNLGTIGKGGGGGNGSGYGRGAGGLGGRRAHAPDVVPGTAQVRGSLDKEIIRRIIRRHLNEVRFCYEKELMHKQDLYGRIMIQFTISGNGQVVASVVQNSTMNNPNVEQCIAQAVRRWEFPKPQGGGIVIVSYPFVLKAAGAE